MVRKYLAKRLKGEQLKLISEKINTNLSFARQALIEKLLLAATRQLVYEKSALGLQQARELAKSLNEDLFSPEEKATIDEYFAPKQPYTYAQLTNAFAVAEEFESFTTRSAAAQNKQPLLQALSPENEANIEGDFILQLLQPLPLPLLLTIRNNKGEYIIKNQLLAPNTALYTVPLPNLAPGRYYWQLKADVTTPKDQEKYGIILRSFFIRKDLYVG